MAQAQVVMDAPLAVAVDLGGLGILTAVIAAVVTAVVALRKSKPEATEILARVSIQLTESQQALLEDRDGRLATLETECRDIRRKYGVLQNTVDELTESLERAEHERDKAVERARLAERQAERAEARASAADTRATAAEAEVARLQQRVDVLDGEVARLRAQLDGTKERPGA